MRSIWGAVDGHDCPVNPVCPLLVIRESKSADDIAALINESLRAVPDLRDIAVVIIRLSESDPDGCNWAARQANTRLSPSPELLRLIDEIVQNAQRNFNLFEVH